MESVAEKILCNIYTLINIIPISEHIPEWNHKVDTVTDSKMDIVTLSGK